jgi:hypothetical protein
MSTRVIFLGWNRPAAGREQTSAALFPEFLGYLGGLEKKGDIDSFDVVVLYPHGGDLNGFFLIRGDNDQLDALQASDDFLNQLARASYNLEGTGAIRGVTGEGVMDFMNRWSAVISG